LTPPHPRASARGLPRRRRRPAADLRRPAGDEVPRYQGTALAEHSPARPLHSTRRPFVPHGSGRQAQRPRGPSGVSSAPSRGKREPGRSSGTAGERPRSCGPARLPSPFRASFVSAGFAEGYARHGTFRREKVRDRPRSGIPPRTRLGAPLPAGVGSPQHSSSVATCASLDRVAFLAPSPRPALWRSTDQRAL